MRCVVEASDAEDILSNVNAEHKCYRFQFHYICDVLLTVFAPSLQQIDGASHLDNAAAI